MYVSRCVLNTKTLPHALVALLLLVQIAGHPLAETAAAPAVSSAAPNTQSRETRRPPPPPPPPSAEELQKTIDTLTVLLADKPDDIKTLRLRGEAYAEADQHDLAIADLTRLTRLIPLNQDVWGDLCRAYVLTQRLEQARGACEMAVSLGNTRSRYTLGHVFLLQDDRINAWNWYEKGFFDILVYFESLDLGKYGLQPQLVDHAQRWFEVKRKEWSARDASADKLGKEAEAAQSAKDYAKAIDLTKQLIPLLEVLNGPADVHVRLAAFSLGNLYARLGRETDAEKFFSNRISLLENDLGPDHPDLASNLFLFGEFYRNLRAPQYQLAEPLYKRALEIFEKANGPEHPSIVPVLSTLAALYKATDRPEAEATYKRLIALEEKIDGIENTVGNLNNLAEYYAGAVRDSEAELLYKRALAIREKALGPDHPDVAASLSSIAGLYSDQYQYEQAEPLYKRALVIREKANGLDHPDVVGSLNDLGYMYKRQGQYGQSELHYKRALAIREKAHGPDHPDVVKSLNDLAELYESQGRYSDAESFYKRSLAIREKAYGPDHFRVALSLKNLAVLYKVQGQYAQAEPLYKRALAIIEKSHGPDHPNVVPSLKDLAWLYFKQNRYAQAELLYKRSLAIREKALGPDHADVAESLNDLVRVYWAQGHHSEVELLYKRSLAIREKALGPDHTDVAESLNDLARVYRAQGRHSEIELLYKRALAIREKALGPDHHEVATSLNDLAALYLAQGHYAQAEPFLQRALAIEEMVFGPRHPEVATNLYNLARLDEGPQLSVTRRLAIKEKAQGLDHFYVADSLENLALMYTLHGHYAKAELLYKRSLAIMEKSYGPDHPNVARSLGLLSELYLRQGQYTLVEPLAKRSLAIYEKAAGPDHFSLTLGLNTLAKLYLRQGLYAQTELLAKRSMAIYEKAFGPGNPDVDAMMILADLYRTQGHSAQAEPLYKRSLAIIEKFNRPDHPALANILNSLALLYDRQGQYGQALSMNRRASAIYKERIVAGGTGDAAVQEANRNRPGFFLHLALLSQNPDKEAADTITDEAIQIVQLEQASGTASAIAKMAARFASGDDALAGLIKRKQDASDRRTGAEAQLVTASSKTPQERNAVAEQGLRDGSARALQEIATIDAELTRQFPEYQELARPEPLSVGQIRTLLKPGEAMLVYALGESSFLWVVKPDSAVFMPLEARVKEVTAKVATIRAEMDLDGAGKTMKVSVGVLHDLYQSLFSPAIAHLAGVQHLMVVPAGPLQSLPFGMLVASPAPKITGDADYRRVDWLAMHYAISVLPSVSSIQAFRQFAKAGGAQEPFAGFGDPLIGGKGGATRGKRGKVDVAVVFRNLSNKGNAPAGAPAMEIADVEAIRSQQRLPETADELVAMAKVLKSDQKSLWLRESATETRIKNLDLSKYRTLAFATHGVMAGEMKGVGESGLILTPPQQGSSDDDGYLSAGEIARLKLNADWVVLSACNTAAADGTPGAEGLSGLAKAFFYAGARSLLVSHWPVASEATVPLTTEMLKEYEANPGQGKSEAHRKAMMALMATPDHPEYAHPIFWAPFVVVGEGGASGGTVRPMPVRVP